MWRRAAAVSRCSLRSSSSSCGVVAAVWWPCHGAHTRMTALHAAARAHGNTGDTSKPLHVSFVLQDGTTRQVTAYEGQTLLDVCAAHGLPVEGACGGACACSTCHVYLEPAAMATFPPPSDVEDDMIDMAFFPQPTSRLGCQLRLEQRKHDGLKVTLPKATRNMYVDGASVKPH